MNITRITHSLPMNITRIGVRGELKVAVSTVVVSTVAVSTVVVSTVAVSIVEASTATRHAALTPIVGTLAVSTQAVNTQAVSTQAVSTQAVSTLAVSTQGVSTATRHERMRRTPSRNSLPLSTPNQTALVLVAARTAHTARILAGAGPSLLMYSLSCTSTLIQLTLSSCNYMHTHLQFCVQHFFSIRLQIKVPKLSLRT